MSKQKIGSEQLALLSNIGIITFSNTGNFSSGNNALGSAATVVIPPGCTKVLIIGQVRLQQQSSTQTDVSAWMGMDGSTTNILRNNIIYTGPNGSTATFASATCAVMSDATVTPGSHTFQLYGNAGQSSSASLCNIFIIPVGG